MILTTIVIAYSLVGLYSQGYITSIRLGCDCKFREGKHEHFCLNDIVRWIGAFLWPSILLWLLVKPISSLGYQHGIRYQKWKVLRAEVLARQAVLQVKNEEIKRLEQAKAEAEIEAVLVDQYRQLSDSSK